MVFLVLKSGVINITMTTHVPSVPVFGLRGYKQTSTSWSTTFVESSIFAFNHVCLFDYGTNFQRDEVHSAWL